MTNILKQLARIGKQFSFINLPKLQPTSIVNGRTGFSNNLHQCRQFSVTCLFRDTIAPPIPIENATINLKKKAYKKRSIEVAQKEGHFVALAFATANEYNLEGIKLALEKEKLYEPGKITTTEVPDVVHASAKYKIGDEPREIFFFREGAVVFWNCTDLEASNVLMFLKAFEMEPYPESAVLREREIMPFFYNSGKKCQLQGSAFVLVSAKENILEKYTFSNAMAQSVKLGIWEDYLEQLAESIQAVTGDMERGRKIALTKEDVVRKAGALFALRHRINVDSDLLDTPDFYWEQEELEQLYTTTISYFTISRRTKVINDRVAHCVELMELLSTWLSDKHHVRLEWMIIILIMVEVAFELLHAFEKFGPVIGTAHHM